RSATDGKAELVVRPRRAAEGAFAAGRDERVELRVAEVGEDALHAAVELERVRPRRADDRSPARQETGDLARPERLEQPLDETFPAVAHADHVAAADHHPPTGRPDDGVQAGTVTAAGEHTNAHRCILRTLATASAAASARTRRRGRPTRTAASSSARCPRRPAA